MVGATCHTSVTSSTQKMPPSVPPSLTSHVESVDPVFMVIRFDAKCASLHEGLQGEGVTSRLRDQMDCVQKRNQKP